MISISTNAISRWAFPVVVTIVNLFVVGFSLFIDFMPTIFGAYSDQRFLLVFCTLLFVVGGLAFRRNAIRLKYALTSMFPVTVLVLSFLLAVFQFSDIDFYLVEPVFYSLYFLAFSILGFKISRIKNLSDVLVPFIMVLAVSCFFYAAMTITVYLFAITDDFAKLDRVIPWGFVNIRYWSHIATWIIPLLPLAILLGPLKTNKLWRAGVAFTAAMWWWMIFMSGSRGSMVGIVLGFFFVFVFFGRSSRPWIATSFKYVLFGLVAWLILSLIIPSLVFDDLQIRSIGSDSSGRIPLWQEAWAMSLQNFPFGMGPQSWLTHDIITQAYRDSPKFGHPHNMYLMWAAEYGWFSILGIVIAGGIALKRLVQKRAGILKGTNPHGMALIAFTASVTGALVHAGVSAVFIAPASMLIGLLVLSLFWGLIHPEVSDSDARPESARNRGTRLLRYGLIVLVVGGGALYVQKVLQYHYAMVEDLPYYQEHVHAGTLPRFWFHGNFPRRPGQMP